MGIFDNLKNKVNLDEIKDKMKLDEIRDRASDIASAGLAKSRIMAEIAKLKANSMAEEDAMKKAYIEIGKAVCVSLDTGAELEVDVYVEKVKACQALIASNNAKIAALKNEGEITEEEAAAVAELIEAPAEVVEDSTFEQEDAAARQEN